LVTGGSRSGKSTFAEQLAIQSPRPVVYLATCRTSDLDAEMQDRIRRHRAQRPAAWETLEDLFDLVAVAEAHAGKTLLLDCLTLWLADAMGRLADAEAILSELDAGLQAMLDHGIHAIIVSNEIGMGLVPLGKENRAYRDLVGWANQRVARHATHVQFIVAGLPLNLK